MSKENNVKLNGVEQWIHLIKRFNQSPKDSLETMRKHGLDVASVLIYLETLLSEFKLHPMDREKLGKVKDLLDDEGMV